MISNFSVFRADRRYRPVTNEHIIRFTASTKVTFVSIPVPNISRYKFEFVPFQQIHLRHPDNMQLCGMTLNSDHFTFKL